MIPHLTPLSHLQDSQTFYGVTDSFTGFALRALARHHPQKTLLHVCCHEARLNLLAQEMMFLDRDIDILVFPPWDCLPYDRLSPKKDIIGKRVETLVRLLEPQVSPRIVLAHSRSFFHRLPPRDLYGKASFDIVRGGKISLKDFEHYLISQGFTQTLTVREPGEFSFRGNIIDFFPAAHSTPYRLDLFGDVVEELKTFDPLTQCSQEMISEVRLHPAHEISLTAKTISHFRTTYRSYFGSVVEKDPLYESISAGRSYPGIEHWLPFFYSQTDTLLDYVREQAVICFDQGAMDAAKSHLEQVQEYYEARLTGQKANKRLERLDGKRKVGMRESTSSSLPLEGRTYRPVPPALLYPSLQEMEQKLTSFPVIHFSSFAPPLSPAPLKNSVDLGARPVPDFSAFRHRQDVNLFDHVKERLQQSHQKGKKTIIACVSVGSCNRFSDLLTERGLIPHILDQLKEEILETLPLGHVGLIALSLDYGFETDDFLILTEQDILGERQTRKSRRQRRSDLLIGEAASLDSGDYVVHQEHGIGQFQGLTTLQIDGMSHDCVMLTYEGGDKLFVPVENLDLLSRYGGESSFVMLDKLGTAAWQTRKAKIKKRLLEIAQYLIDLAAKRHLEKAEIFQTPEGLYQEFSAAFPYTETEDQAQAIQETLDDLKKGKPMDRLICGDVGFGKTEVALRAAFVVAVSGQQVAVVVPTTLLCQQHFRQFQDRFQGFGLRIAQLSRLVSQKDLKAIHEDLASGKVDIVVGTHALLSPKTTFKQLGLVIVDEEQHFGVKQKEKLKALQHNVHLLTLSATPIPRTLQMALCGVRDLSLITTPPVDRLAVRTFVMPFDPVILREAILREIYRGGQVFYVCPRIEDLESVMNQLKDLVPEAQAVIAHGQLSAGDLEQVMEDFYNKKFQILLATNIIESGLDMPWVNTILIHRADLFGLAQLYQLRGRVGRAKTRGYAYLILPEHRTLSTTAQKKLEVMQTLDTLGAGLQLASYDMDIRGAGNLLGEEQSGHIREVGVELYQQMLEQALYDVRTQGNRRLGQENASKGAESSPHPEAQSLSQKPSDASPQLHLGLTVMIPDTYVPDLSVRLNLYRRLARLETEEEVEKISDEMVDRFGPLPEPVKNLLDIVIFKQICQKIGIEKVEVGDKGCSLSFMGNQFENPQALIHYIAQGQGTIRLRSDHKLIFLRVWPTPHAKVQGVRQILLDMKQLIP